MKPFNLKEALEGKEVIYRDDLRQETLKVARVVHVPERNTEHCVLVVYANGQYDWVDENGSTRLIGPVLFMAPKLQKGWINIYPDRAASNIHRTKGAADTHASLRRVACVEIEWEE